MLGNIFNRKRRAFEELATASLDGVLDAPGEERLRHLTGANPALAQELNELAAVTSLVRSMPQEEAPRSFALPYAPAMAPAPAASRGLRWMQTATASAALLLIALIATDLSGVTGTADVTATALEANRVTSEKQAGTGSSGDLEFAAVPESGLALDGDAPPEAGDTSRATTESAPIMEGAVAEDDGTTIASAAPIDDSPGAVGGEGSGRSVLDWAVVASGLATAVMALLIVAMAWTIRRNPA